MNPPVVNGLAAQTLLVTDKNTDKKKSPVLITQGRGFLLKAKRF
jgi:hypothetical protein